MALNLPNALSPGDPQRGHNPQVTLLENKAVLEPGLVALACNLSTWELETGGSPVHSQSGLGHCLKRKVQSC